MRASSFSLSQGVYIFILIPTTFHFCAWTLIWAFIFPTVYRSYYRVAPSWLRSSFHGCSVHWAAVPPTPCEQSSSGVAVPWAARSREQRGVSTPAHDLTTVKPCTETTKWVPASECAFLFSCWFLTWAQSVNRPLFLFLSTSLWQLSPFKQQQRSETFEYHCKYGSLLPWKPVG